MMPCYFKSSSCVWMMCDLIYCCHLIATRGSVPPNQQATTSTQNFPPAMATAAGATPIIYTMSRTSATNIQQTPLATMSNSQQSIQTIRGSYGPPSIREWVQEHNPNPSRQEIASERHRRQYDIHRDHQEYPAQSGNNFLHPHFCHNTNDRKLTFQEGVGDIHDAVCSYSSLKALSLIKYLGDKHGPAC